MNVETLKKHSFQTKTLIQTGKKRIESLLRKLDDKYKESMIDEDYREMYKSGLQNWRKLLTKTAMCHIIIIQRDVAFGILGEVQEYFC